MLHFFTKIRHFLKVSNFFIFCRGKGKKVLLYGAVHSGKKRNFSPGVDKSFPAVYIIGTVLSYIKYKLY